MRSFQSGIMLPSGQPLWQKGIPQSMQRAPWALSFSSGILFSYSRQSCSRSFTGRRDAVSRSISKKPPILPIQPASFPKRYSSAPARPLRPRAANRAGPPAPSWRGPAKPYRPLCASDRRQLGRFGIQMLTLDHFAILGGQNLNELAHVIVPAIQQPARHRALGILIVPGYQSVNLLDLGVVLESDQLHHAGIAAPREGPVFIEHERDSAAHPGR